MHTHPTSIESLSGGKPGHEAEEQWRRASAPERDSAALTVLICKNGDIITAFAPISTLWDYRK